MGPAIAALIVEPEKASRTAAKTQRPELLPLLAHTYQAAAAMLVKVGVLRAIFCNTHFDSFAFVKDNLLCNVGRILTSET
ncbi:MAG TPA: hypothetical protein VEF72_27075 [Mycobacterium sp.]|nr:hypothetical protein [Mycobacterium sp.]